MEHWREEPASGWRERWCTGEVWAPAISLLPPERETEERERNGDHGEVAQWWAVGSGFKFGHGRGFSSGRWSRAGRGGGFLFGRWRRVPTSAVGWAAIVFSLSFCFQF
jgi:hypothetical protein